MHGDIVSCRDCSHAVEDAFGPCLARHRVNDNVGGWKRSMDSFSGGTNQFAGVFKGVAAGQGKREIGKIVWSGATDTRLFNGQHTGHLFGFANHAHPSLRRNLIHEHTDSFARQLRGNANNHEGDKDATSPARMRQIGQAGGVTPPEPEAIRTFGRAQSAPLQQRTDGYARWDK